MTCTFSCWFLVMVAFSSRCHCHCFNNGLLNLAMINMCSLASYEGSLVTGLFLNTCLLDWSGLAFTSSLLHSPTLFYGEWPTATLLIDFSQGPGLCLTWPRDSNSHLLSQPWAFSSLVNRAVLLFPDRLSSNSWPYNLCCLYYPMVISISRNMQGSFFLKVPIHWPQLRCPCLLWVPQKKQLNWIIWSCLKVWHLNGGFYFLKGKYSPGWCGSVVWISYHPINWRTAGSIPIQGTCLVCRFCPWLGHTWGMDTPISCGYFSFTSMFLSLFLPTFPPL